MTDAEYRIEIALALIERAAGAWADGRVELAEVLTAGAATVAAGVDLVDEAKASAPHPGPAQFSGGRVQGVPLPSPGPTSEVARP